MMAFLVSVLEERRERFGPGNDEVWGAGSWVECAACPDGFGFPAFHHWKVHSGTVTFVDEIPEALKDKNDNG